MKVEYAIVPLTFCMAIAIVTYARLIDSPEEVATLPAPIPTGIPDFAAYTDIKQKKRDFFEFLLPMIRAANANVTTERRRLVKLGDAFQADFSPSASDERFIRELSERYRVKVGEEITRADLTELLKRVDVIPASLILAQAANESAWGTSRFARNAHNFFGIWCFTPGCGLTPRLRDENLSHEIRRFASVNEGVAYYLLTINSNPAYRGLRDIRADLRQSNVQITGARLAEGLLRYSERGQHYVSEIQEMIRYNELSRYTLATIDNENSDG